MFGPYGRAQSVVGVIGQRDDFAFAIEGDHAAAWTKDFLPHHCAVVSQAGPQRGFHVEAARLIALDLRNSAAGDNRRSEEHTSELQSLMRISYAVLCLKKKQKNNKIHNRQLIIQETDNQSRKQ